MIGDNRIAPGHEGTKTLKTREQKRDQFLWERNKNLIFARLISTSSPDAAPNGASHVCFGRGYKDCAPTEQGPAKCPNSRSRHEVPGTPFLTSNYSHVREHRRLPS